MGQPAASNQTHEEWCHERIDTLERQLEALATPSTISGGRAAPGGKGGDVTITSVPGPEQQRAQFHHELLRDVLKESIRAKVSLNQRLSDADVAEFVRAGIRAADLAYPPPKVGP